MEILLKVLTILVAALHGYFLWFEMFAWTTRGKKIFRSIPEDLFEPTKILAANQGLYNGFLAAGLIWSLYLNDPVWKLRIASFFFICVAIAGIFGAITAHRKIFFVQALPALVALVPVYYLSCH